MSINSHNLQFSFTTKMREVGEVAGGGGGAQVANDRVYRDNAEVPEGYKTNLSFTQLLMV